MKKRDTTQWLPFRCLLHTPIHTPLSREFHYDFFTFDLDLILLTVSDQMLVQVFTIVMALPDEYFMQMALKEAKYAAEAGEIPVGAVITANGKLLAKAHNQTETLKDVTAHAEMLAITAAANYLQSKFLDQCTLFVTLEPCPMCASALYWARIGRLVIGAKDEKRGFSLIEQSLLHPKTQVQSGLLAEESESILKEFFLELRNK